MTYTRRRTLKVVGTAGSLTLFGSQAVAGFGDDELADDHDELTDDQAAGRGAHLSPDAPNVDVYLDDDQVLTDVPFGAISDYLTVDTGTYTATITAAGDPETVAFEGDLEFENEFYTLAAIGELGQDTFEPLFLRDRRMPREPDQVAVRLVHASPDAPAVDVTVADEGITAFDDVAFGEHTDYIDLAPGTYTLEVRGATDDDTGDVVATFDVELEANTVYTAFAAGYLEPEAAAEDVPFDLIVTLDGVAAMEAPADEEEVDEREEEPEDDDEHVDEDDEHLDDEDDEDDY